MSKAEIINNIQTEILKTGSYLFDQHKAELVGKGVSNNEDIIKSIDILRNETYQTYKSKNLKLNQKYIKQLKVLSILTQFFQRTSFNLNKLAISLQVSREECLKLLLEASISKLISVKINEQSGDIVIVNSKIRERQINSQTAKLSNGKIIQVKDKNRSVQQNLNKLIESFDRNSEKQNEKGMISK